MSTIFMMKFNDSQGAILADESCWHLSHKYGYRRANYGDAVFVLQEPQHSDVGLFTTLYTGVGFPSLHNEVVENYRAAISASGGKSTPSTVGETSELVYRMFQKAQGRMIDDRIRFLYGFGRNDLHALSFACEGKTYPIKQQGLISDAKKISTGSDHSDPLLRIFENQGAVMGFSHSEGIQAWYISGEYTGITFASALTVLGEGSQVANHIFGKWQTTLDLTQRRRGFDLVPGLLLLLQVAVETGQFQSKMGGYFQMAVIDGKAETPSQMIRLQAGHELKLASEVAKAVNADVLERSRALTLIDKILVGDMPFAEAEDLLFSSCKDVRILQRFLSGYKLRSLNSVFSAGA